MDMSLIKKKNDTFFNIDISALKSANEHDILKKILYLCISMLAYKILFRMILYFNFLYAFRLSFWTYPVNWGYIFPIMILSYWLKGNKRESGLFMVWLPYLASSIVIAVSLSTTFRFIYLNTIVDIQYTGFSLYTKIVEVIICLITIFFVMKFFWPALKINSKSVLLLTLPIIIPVFVFCFLYNSFGGWNAELFIYTFCILLLIAYTCLCAYYPTLLAITLEGLKFVSIIIVVGLTMAAMIFEMVGNMFNRRV